MIRHELSVDGTLDFNFTDSGTSVSNQVHLQSASPGSRSWVHWALPVLFVDGTVRRQTTHADWIYGVTWPRVAIDQSGCQSRRAQRNETVQLVNALCLSWAWIIVKTPVMFMIHANDKLTYIPILPRTRPKCIPHYLESSRKQQAMYRLAELPTPFSAHSATDWQRAYLSLSPTQKAKPITEVGLLSLIGLLATLNFVSLTKQQTRKRLPF